MPDLVGRVVCGGVRTRRAPYLMADLDAGTTGDSAPATDDEHLARSLAGLSELIVDDSTLELLLTQVSALAAAAIPGADGAGTTLLDAGQPDVIVGSEPFVREIDRVQYRIGEGPCISAAASARTTGSGALGEDAAWPTFGPMAAALDIHSALSLPLIVHGEVLGALNVYAHARDAFAASSHRLGERFAVPAAVVLHNARTLSRAGRATLRAEGALVRRASIDQAIGIVMARSGITADEAFVRLRILSQRNHTKLHDVAVQLVDEAVRRAQARKSPP